MLQTGSLQVPKPAGRSRFSKALPAIPGIDDSSSEPPSTSTTTSVPASAPKVLADPRTLPDLPPPPPPPHDDDPKVPIQFTPLPPLPSKKPVQTATAAPTPTGGPSKMAISRKPVGSQKQSQVEGGKPHEVQPQPQPQPDSLPQQMQQEHGQEHDQELLAQFPQVPQKEQDKDQPKRQADEVQAQTQTQDQPLPPVPAKSASRTESALKPPQLLSPPQPQDSPDPQHQQAPKSPSDSLSSLLSAYSRSSTASVVRSSDGTVYSAVEYQANEPSKHNNPSGSTANFAHHEGKNSASTVTNSAGLQQKPSLTRKPVADGSPAASSPPPPPPPAKDDFAQRPSSPARALNAVSGLPAPSPPRQQIWRRRSLKGSRELPDLRLDHSHGSTASTSTASTVTAVQKSQPLSKSPSPPAVPEKTSASTADSASREQPPEPPAKSNPTMGHGASRIERLKNKFHVHHGSSDSTKSAKRDQSAPAVNRPPTPEYHKEEDKTAAVSTFVSPASPASSPEPAKKTSPDGPADLPKNTSGGPTNTETKPIARKAVPAPAPALQPVKSLPDLKTKTPQTSNEPLPPMSAFPASGRNSPAFDSAPTRGRQPGPAGTHPPSSRNTSARPSSRGSVRPSGRFTGPGSDPRIVRSASGEFMYRGRDGTLYPEMKELADPDPKATQFPTQSSELPSPGAIFKAPPLKQSHFTCYQKHRTMLRRPNKRYPLACQTCQKQDTDDRFSCSFCYVRICEACLKSFEAKQRDLQALIDELSNNGTLSLSSPTRRGSALGLQINF